MKKENQQQARQTRAEAKKKQEQKEKIRKILLIAIPSVLILALIIFIIVSEARSNSSAGGENETNSSEEQNNSEAPSAEESSSQSPELSSDASLTVENGDTVNIDYVGSVDNVEFAGGSTGGAGTDLVIGSHKYIDDFEDQLIGAHPGENVDVVVTFPENYGNEELNGKEALFKVVINGIYR